MNRWMDAFSFFCIYSIAYASVFLLLQEKACKLLDLLWISFSCCLFSCPFLLFLSLSLFSFPPFSSPLSFFVQAGDSQQSPGASEPQAEPESSETDSPQVGSQIAAGQGRYLSSFFPLFCVSARSNSHDVTSARLHPSSPPLHRPTHRGRVLWCSFFLLSFILYLFCSLTLLGCIHTVSALTGVTPDLSC